MVALALSAGAQTVAVRNPRPQTVGVPARILREVKDPHTGETWLLLQNAVDPAGPGRMVRSGQGAAAGTRQQAETPIIRSGDRLVVEERGAVVEAQLEATALEPAASGSALRARLKIGGRVIRVVAVAPGRAEVRQ